MRPSAIPLRVAEKRDGAERFEGQSPGAQSGANDARSAVEPRPLATGCLREATRGSAPLAARLSARRNARQEVTQGKNPASA